MRAPAGVPDSVKIKSVLLTRGVGRRTLPLFDQSAPENLPVVCTHRDQMLGRSTRESMRVHSLQDVRRLGTMKVLDRITLDPSVRFGKPCVRGTRITVGDVLGYLAAGMPEEQILGEFPQLTRDDVRACLAYAAERERRTLGVPAG